MTLIDESYNSNPSALISSLESVLLMNPKGRKILVLGEMRELDDFSESLHREVGKQIGKMFAENPTEVVVFGVGKETQALLAEVLKANSKIATFFAETVEQVEPLVLTSLRSQDLVFLNGSRGIALDKLVKRLKASPP
jgi:UDP-N-acetylmuramoyl-tripeptide--D-alanyl-D-alanine ligase